MAKMGRPKVEDPINKVVTVKFPQGEHELLVEYAKAHELSVAQVIRASVRKYLKDAQE